MHPEQELYCQNRVADLVRHIERFERLAAECLTDGSREYWRSEIEILENRVTAYEEMLRSSSGNAAHPDLVRE